MSVRGVEVEIKGRARRGKGKARGENRTAGA
jgi:hypothetical protein